MEREMKEKEEENRQMLLAEQNERIVRKERIQKEIQKIHQQNLAAVCALDKSYLLPSVDSFLFVY
jgi:hypothetical protein